MVKSFVFMITMGTMGLRKWRRQELGGSAIENEIPNVEFLPEQVMQHMQMNKVVFWLVSILSIYYHGVYTFYVRVQNFKTCLMFTSPFLDLYPLAVQRCIRPPFPWQDQFLAQILEY